jgi:hypothetical protein
MYELCQVDTVMKQAADNNTMSVPVDVLYNGWGPLGTLLDVLYKRRAVGGVPDEQLVDVSNHGIIY